MTKTSGLTSVRARLQRVTTLAREAPERVLTTLSHHVDHEWLKEAFRRTRKDAAPGIDGESAQHYAAELEQNLRDLLERFKSGTYKAPPLRRTYILKADGKSKRALGIPTFEDKVLQRAVAMLLEAVYEQDFRDCSYGYRPGRSAHDALEALRKGLMRMGGGYVLEVDIRSFFDTIDHQKLRAILDQRIRDGVLRRTIDKWFKAGILEEGILQHKDEGTPQGAGISPLLANVYLHEVLDRWFEDEIQPRLEGESFLIRFADDFVIVFAQEQDARRVDAVLPKRFGRYGLELHPDKTRLVGFERPTDRRGKQTGAHFDFLGFTHYWGRTRRRRWVVKQKTSHVRFSRGLKAISAWCRKHRHLPLEEQQRALSRKLLGHYQYYGITGNSASLSRFRYEVERTWHRWLQRRSQRSGANWQWFSAALKRWRLPPARAVHSILARG